MLTIPQAGQGGVVMPVAAMLAAQALLSMATVTLPVLAPAAATEIGAPVAWVGLFVAIVYGTSMACGLASAALVRRWGALRLSQLCLLSASAGVALLCTGHLAGLAAAAVLLGMGYGPLNPASSHLLTQVSPPQHLSKVFSLKQTGVPLGAALAGALLPALVLWGNWQTAALCVAAACSLLAVALQPLRAGFDADRTPGARISLGSLAEPARLAVADRAGWPLALSSFCFAALQLCLGTYLVAYLTTDLGYDLVQAGLTLAVTQGAGVAGRLLAGALADRIGQPRKVMGGMGCVMGLCATATAFAGHWPTPLLLLLYVFFGASAIGWNGVYLAEVARRAPPGAVSAATAAALFVTFAGVLAGPPIFTSMIQSGMHYGAAFMVIAAPALVCGLVLLRAPRRTAG
ncbi:MAG: MFS transporter [Burkholderiaceae bacterium]|nr:MFS transporter [Burkholderiaceae bacterium]